MSDSPVFELVCEHVQKDAGVSRLEARGTVRLLLKEVGLDPQLLSKAAALLAVDRGLVRALRVRRVAEPELVKARVVQALQQSALEDPAGDDPEAIFARIPLGRA